jgi:capsular exopolysaccharide synthesis family protein
MESLKKALELAQDSRLTTTKEQWPAAQPASVGALDGQITYTRTLTYDPAPEELTRRRVITGEQAGAVATAYKILRAQVLQLLKENGWNAFAVVSPNPGEGKTLTAVNLAVVLAEEVNHTVLLVDLDLRNPSIHHHFDFRPVVGLADHLLEDLSLEQILFSPGIEGLVVLPGTESIHNSSEMMSSPKLVQLVRELEARYPNRIVIFDLPPLLCTADALAFLPFVDAALMVVEERRTAKDDLLRAMELLRPTNVLGTVLNKSHESL